MLGRLVKSLVNPLVALSLTHLSQAAQHQLKNNAHKQLVSSLNGDKSALIDDSIKGQAPPLFSKSL